MKINSTNVIPKVKPVIEQVSNKVYSNPSIIGKIEGFDSFTISPLTRKINNIYDKICAKLDNITPEDVKRTVMGFQEFSRIDVLEVMSYLSTFSNMQRVADFRDWLDKYDIYEIETFKSEYDKKDKIVRVKDTDKIHTKFVTGKFLNLNQALGYFYNASVSNTVKCPLHGNSKSAIILDSRVLDYLEDLKGKNPDKYEKLKRNYVFIYIKNFENSYNIFEQDVDFESLTKKYLKKVERLKKSNPGLTTSKAMDIILNGRNTARIKSLGLEPLIANFQSSIQPTPYTISKNLTSTIPSKEVFVQKVNDVFEQFKYSEEERLLALDFLDENLYVITMKELAKKLRILHNKILQDVQAHGKGADKIFYNIAKVTKSFALINYMYQKLNDISSSRLIYWEHPVTALNSFAYKKMAEKLPKGSTLVIMDDAFISGESIFVSQFKYFPNREDGHFDMLFAAPYATGKAHSVLKDFKNKPEGDRIVSVDSQGMGSKLTWSSLLPAFKNSAIMLPYNAPDNNSVLFREVFKLFYPAGTHFVQEPWVRGE